MSLLADMLERRRLMLATALLLALAGVASWMTMPREEDPAFPRRNGLVVTPFPGADAETVERLVVEPIEEHLAEVEEVWEVVSTARAGVAIVRIELHEHIYATDDAWDEVEDAVAVARREFPAGVGEPELEDDTVSQEAVVLALTGDPDPLALERAAEKIKRRLLAIDGVKQVELLADPGQQITIEYDDATARRLGLDPRRLGAQLANRSQILPGGIVHLGARTANLRPRTEFTSLEEIRATPILLPSGSSVPLGELARVRLGPEEPASSRMRWNGEPAVGLGVIPQDGLDRVRFGRAVREAVAEVAAEVQPIAIDEVVFQPDSVEQRLDQLTGSLRLGILIVAVVLFVAMGFRLGVLVALVLPLVTFGSIAIFATGGGILHQISIAALVIALGMLVDNAIVVAENIQWRLDRGLQVRQAAVESVRSLALPLGTATGTTLAAFVPMLLAKGGTGDFTRSIPILIMLTLSVSYLFAVLVTPVLAELLLRRRTQESHNALEGWARRMGGFAVRRAPWVLVGAVLLLATTLFAAGWLEQQFFPAADRSLVIVDLQMAEGTHLERTDEVTQRLEGILMAHPEVSSVASFVGRAAPHFYYNLLSRPNSPHRAQLVVGTTSLASVETLIQFSRDVAQREMPAVEVVARRLEQGPPIDAPIEVRVLGAELDAMEQVADAVLAELRTADGTRDVRHDLGLGVPTVVFHIDDAAAARHGLARNDVAIALLGRTLGSPVGQYRMAEDPIPILVRSSAGENFPVDDLDGIDVAAPGGTPIPLAQLARSEVEWRPAAIHHHERERVITVRAQLAEGVTAHHVLQEIGPRLEALEMPAGVRWQLGGELEESGKANQALFGAMPLGLLLLLFFLLAEFNSFRRVGIVLVTVPLAATGVVPGLLLSGNPFGFMSMLGVISLVGIVVNNAIVLLDVVESLRQEGFPMVEALIEAVQRRTRPILLTMVTTVAGLSPLAFSDTSLWPPLAWAMISGLVASTVLTLLVVPALYRVLFWNDESDAGARAGGRWGWLAAIFGRRRAEAGAAVVLALLMASPAVRATSDPVSAGASDPAPNLELTLEEVLERSSERPAVQAAEARAVAAGAEATTARRVARWPVVQVLGDLTRRDRDYDFATPLGDFTLGERTSHAFTLAVVQPVLDPAALFYAAPAAASAATAAELDAERRRLEVAAEAAGSFLAVLALDAQQRATEAFVDSLRARLAENEERVRRGRILEADALKVRLDLESAELDLIALAEARRAAVWDLGRVVGHEGPVEPAGVPLAERGTPPAVDDLVERAQEGRQDLEAIEYRLRALELQAKAIGAERLPRVEARAVVTRADGDPFRPEALVEGTLGVVWTPFAAGSRKPRRAALVAEREALAADLSELRRSLSVGVRQRLADLETARAAVEVRRRGLELATETRRVEAERHAAGRSTTNDLLDAEAALRRQSTQAELARIEVLRAWIGLALTVGDADLL